MKRFIIRSLIYLSPLLLVFLVVFLVDPYYLFHKDRAFDEQRFEIGYSFDQGRRYKIFTYWNNPTEKIILGASEINIINERNIPEEGWHSLSYGGAPLQESLQMYWEVSKEHHLTKVIIAPEFIKYFNAISSANGDPYYANFKWESCQSAIALNIYSNILDYFVDKYTLKTTFSYVVNLIHSQKTQSKPAGTKEEFWKHQMGYAHHVYREGSLISDKKKEVKNLFKLIKEDAEKKDVEVIVVIPIQHVELLKEEFQEGVYNTYLEYISSLIDIFGGVYYLAFTDGVSQNADMFSDPFHCTFEKPYLDYLFGENTDNRLTQESVKEYLDEVRSILYPHGK